MNSMPRTASFHHQCISSTVAKAVTELPGTLDDLVADYADEGGFAELRFELDSGYKVIDNDTNKQIKTAIENILTCEGELGRKRTIFKNVELLGPKFLRGVVQIDQLIPLAVLDSHRSAVCDILNKIKAQGQQINLNYVDFTGIDLHALNLSGATAIAARFDSAVINSVNWSDGDFTGALFRNVQITSSGFSAAIMHKTFWTHSRIEACWLNRADMFKAIMDSVTFNVVVANQIETDDRGLLKLIKNYGPGYGAPEVFKDLTFTQQFFLNTFFDPSDPNKVSLLHGSFSSSSS